MKKEKFCRECRDGEKKVEATVYVTGLRVLDTGMKIPYQGPICDDHLESIQNEDVEVKFIRPIEPEEK